MDSKLIVIDKTWAEINLDHLVHNYRVLKKIIHDSQIQNEAGSHIPSTVQMMAVVKGNAYGHGSVEIARTLMDEGMNYFAVASIDEAIELRKNQIHTPILIFGDTPHERCQEIIEYDLTQTIFHNALAKKLAFLATQLKKNVKIHVKIDTGMNRVGFQKKTATEQIKELVSFKGLILEGIYTHFSSADEKDSEYTNRQFQDFIDIIEQLRKIGIMIPLKHACNSAATISYPRMHLDMVRVGIALYGCAPSLEFEKDPLPLKPVMALKTKVVRVNDLSAGERVSYGKVFTTERNTKIATIPIGYADGFTRILTKKAQVLIQGNRIPVVGNICMDQSMVDITDLEEEVQLDDEVVVIGDQKGEGITATQIASSLGTIHYEVLTMLQRRVPRYYIQNGSFIKRVNYLW